MTWNATEHHFFSNRSSILIFVCVFFFVKLFSCRLHQLTSHVNSINVRLAETKYTVMRAKRGPCRTLLLCRCFLVLHSAHVAAFISGEMSNGSWWRMSRERRQWRQYGNPLLSIAVAFPLFSATNCSHCRTVLYGTYSMILLVHYYAPDNQ